MACRHVIEDSRAVVLDGLVFGKHVIEDRVRLSSMALLDANTSSKTGDCVVFDGPAGCKHVIEDSVRLSSMARVLQGRAVFKVGGYSEHQKGDQERVHAG